MSVRIETPLNVRSGQPMTNVIKTPKRCSGSALFPAVLVN